MTKDDIKKSPGDFIYAFLTKDGIMTIAKYLGAKKADIIQRKRLCQIQLLRAAYDGNINYDEVAGWIQDAYGMTPSEVITGLISGKSIAGKDWRRGVYGIGATPRNNYADNSQYTVDNKTGKLMSDGQYVTGGLPIYQNNANGETYIDGYSYLLNGISYTTKLGDNNSYYANTYGTKDGGFFADGSVFKVSQGSNFWSGLSTYFPLIKTLLDWLLNLLKRLFGIDTSDSGEKITPEKTVPKQDEFMLEDDKKGMIPILIAALAGGYLILSSNNKKGK